MGEGGDRLLYTVLKALFSFVVLLTVTVGVVFYLFRCEGALGKYMGYCSFGIEDVAVGKGIATGVKEESKDQKGGVGGLMLYVVGNLSKKSQDWYREQFYEVIRDECGASGVVRYDGERLYCSRVEAEFDEVEGLLYVDGRVLDLSVFWDDRDSQRLYFDRGTKVLVIEGGNSVDLSPLLQRLSYDETTNVLTLSEGGSVDLSELEQQLVFDEATGKLSITGGNSVSLGSYRQTLTWDPLNDELKISGGNTVDLSDLSQTLTLVGNVLTISDSGSSVTFTNWDTDVTDDVRELTDLQDVTIASPLTSQVLKYNGTGWVNSALNFVELADTPSNYGASGYLLQTDGLGNIVYVDPLALDVGYWQRTGTVLSPRNLGDDIYLRSGELLGVGFDPSTFSPSTVAAFNGKVGIGTTNPGADLWIEADGYGYNMVIRAPRSTLSLINTYASDKTWSIISGYAYGFEINEDTPSSSSTTRFYIKPGGNVGIGTLTPTQKLHVAGNLKVDGTIYGFYDSVMNDTGAVGLIVKKQQTLNSGSLQLGYFNYQLNSSGLSGTSSWRAVLSSRMTINALGDISVGGALAGVSVTMATSGSGNINTTVYGVGVGLRNYGTGTLNDFSYFRVFDPVGTGPIGNLYGLYIEPLTEGVNNWAIYVDGSTPTYFGGRVGIGTTNLTGQLTVVNPIHSYTPSPSGYNGINLYSSTGQLVGSVSWGGPSSSVPAQMFIGTRNNYPLHLITNATGAVPESSKRMTILPNGNIGIANTNPSGILDIMKDNGLIIFQPTDVTADGQVKDSPTLVFRGKYDSDTTTGVVSSNFDFSIKNIVSATTPSGRLAFFNQGNELFSIFSNGKVRVGNETTTFMPDLFISGSADVDVLVGTPENAGERTILRFLAAHLSDTAFIQAGTSSADTTAKLTISRLYTSGSPLAQFSVYSDKTYFSGNVGIGLPIGYVPGAQLHIHNPGTGAGDHSRMLFTTGDTGLNDGLLVGVNASAEAMLWYRLANPLVFATGNSEKMRLTPSGQLLLGTTTGSEDLVISRPGQAVLHIAADNDNVGDDGTENAVLRFSTDAGLSSLDIAFVNLSGAARLDFNSNRVSTILSLDWYSGAVGINTLPSNNIGLMTYRTTTVTSNTTQNWYGEKVEARKNVSLGVTDTGSLVGSEILSFVSDFGGGVHEGTLSNVVGINVKAGLEGTLHTGTVDTLKVAYLAPYNQSGVLNKLYTLYLDTVQGTAPTIYYGIYQADTSAVNYFAGNVGIGIDNPETLLHIEKYYSNAPVVKIVNRSGAGGEGLVVETTDGNGVGDALRVVTFRAVNPLVMLRIPNHKGGDDKVILAETTGNVGIGTPNPLEKLHIFGSDTAVLVGDPSSGYSALRLVGSMSNGRAYIQAGVSSSDTNAKLRISRYGTTSSTLSEFSVYSDWTYFSGNVSIGNWNPGDNKTLSVFRSVDMSLVSGGVAGYFQTTLDASLGNATHYATGLSSQLYLVTSAASDLTEWDHGFNTIAASPRITGDGYVSSFAGVISRGIYYGGTVGSHYLFRAIRPADGSSGTASINNLYGLYIGPLYSSSSTFVGTGWGIYQAGSEDLNYFAGKLRIGNNISSNAQVLIDGGAEVLDLRGPSSEGQVWITFRNNTGALMGSINMSGTSQNLRLSTPSGIGLLLATGSQGRLQGSLWIVEGDTQLRGNIYDPTDSLLNFTDDVSITGALNVSGNLAVNSNVLFVDALNGRVGIGTSSPSATLDIVGNIEVESSFGFYYSNNFTAMNRFVYVERGDELRFKTPVSVERWNGTAWESWASAPNFAYVTDGRGNTEVQIPNTTSKFRLTYLTDGCLTPYLLIQQEYIPDTFNVTIETSSDQVTWTQRASATGLSGYQSVVNIGGGDQCEKYYRVTFEITSFADSTFRLVGLQLVSTRPGSQGGLLETLLPIDWDYNKNIGLGTNAPQAKLHVVSNLLPDMIVEEMGSTAAAQLRLKNVTRSWDIVSDASPDLFGIWDATSSAWRLVIDGSTGKVGIGTSTPGATLDVVSEWPLLRVKSNGTNTSAEIRVDGGTSASSAWFKIYLNGNEEAFFGRSTYPDVRLGSRNFHDLKFFTNNIERMVIKANGRVGIGTTSPLEKLTLFDGNLLLESQDATSTTTLIDSGLLTLQGEYWDGTQSLPYGFSLQTILESTTPRARLSIQNNAGTELFVIDESGNVGIGVLTPATKLSVSGILSLGGDNIPPSGGVSGLALGSTSTYRWIQSYNLLPLYINPLGNDVIILSGGGGNVGIGTTSPTYPLEVVGDIKARSIILTGGELTPPIRIPKGNVYTTEHLYPHTGILTNWFGEDLLAFKPPYKVERWDPSTSSWIDVTTNADWKKVTSRTGSAVYEAGVTGQQKYRFYFDLGYSTAINGQFIMRGHYNLNKVFELTLETSSDSTFASGNTTIHSSTWISGITLNRGFLVASTDTNAFARYLRVTIEGEAPDPTVSPPTFVDFYLVRAGGQGPRGNRFLVPIEWDDDLNLQILADGSITTPAISWNDDIDTGILHPLADTVAFSTGGNERMRIDSSGNIGIGTTAPLAKLHIDSVNSDSFMIFEQSSEASAWSIGLVDFNPVQEAFIISRGTSLQASPKFTISTAGNVGINTTSPLGILDILKDSGQIYFQPSDITADNQLKNSPELIFRGKYDSDSTTGFATGTYDFKIKNIIESTTPTARLSIQNNAGTELFVIDESGNVGIGTTSPIFKLDVQGSSTAISGNLGTQFQITANPSAVSSAVLRAIWGKALGTGANNMTDQAGLRGVQGQAEYQGSGTVSGAIGVAGFVANTGVGSITNAYSLYAFNPSATSGSIGTKYGLYIENISGGTTDNFAIFSAGGKSYFAGNIGINTTSPTAKLHIYDSTTGGELFKVESAVLRNVPSGYSYRQKVTITNNSNNYALEDYAVRITLDTATLIGAGKMNADCSDLFVTWDDGYTPLYYWIEPGSCNTSTTYVWVKVPYVDKGAGSSTSIYIYYGNPSATFTKWHDPRKVFWYFDDFEARQEEGWLDMQNAWDYNTAAFYSGGMSFKGSDASTANGGRLKPLAGGKEIAVELAEIQMFVRFGEANQAHFPMLPVLSPTGNDIFAVIARATGTWGYNDCSGSKDFPVAMSYAASTWYKLRVRFDIINAKYRVWVDETELTTTPLSLFDEACNLASGNITLGLRVGSLSGTGADMWIDDYLVRKVVDVEPSISFSAEENVTGATQDAVQTVFVVKDGLVGVHTTTPQYPLQVGNPGDGTIAVSNSWLTFSDRRFKREITELDSALEKVLRLRGVHFKWATSDQISVGFIAQEVQDVIPEVVKQDARGYLSVDYGKIVPYLVEAIKELAQKVGTGGISLTYFTEDTNNVLTTAYDLSVPNITATKIFVTDLTASVLKAVSVTIASGKLVISSDGTLTTSADVNVSGTLNVKTVLADQVKTKSLTITTDLAGKVTVKAAETVHTVQIEGIDSNDIVVLTPVNRPVAFGVKVEDQRFTIILSQPQSEDIEFNYVVIKRE